VKEVWDGSGREICLAIIVGVFLTDAATLFSAMVTSGDVFQAVEEQRDVRS